MLLLVVVLCLLWSSVVALATLFELEKNVLSFSSLSLNARGKKTIKREV